MNVALVVRVIRDRVLLLVGKEPPRVLGRIIRCPCCGAATGYEEA